MQDEILKHTEKIYKTAKSAKHSFVEKLKDILVEIFIIVFAVSLSIWLHNRSEHHSQQEETREFFVDIKDDLTKDIESLTQKKKYLANLLQSYAQVRNLTQKQLDTAKNINLEFHLSTLNINNGNYEGFKSSGKIGFIENRKLKKLILEYYQETLPGLYDIDKYHYSKDLETFELINSFHKSQNKLLSDPAIRANINLDDVITQSLITACDQTLANAGEVLKEIDKELNNN